MSRTERDINALQLFIELLAGKNPRGIFHGHKDLFSTEKRKNQKKGRFPKNICSKSTHK